MIGQTRPWWASDGPVDGGIARDEDPVERLRAARRGASEAAPHDDLAEPWLDAVAATMSSLARAAPAPPTDDDDTEGAGGACSGAATETAAGGHQPDVCGVCPICVGLRALAEARPELMGHLAEAARHVALAARSLRERPDEDAAGTRGRSGAGKGRRGEGLEHIDLE